MRSHHLLSLALALLAIGCVRPAPQPAPAPPDSETTTAIVPVASPSSPTAAMTATVASATPPPTRPAPTATAIASPAPTSPPATATPNPLIDLILASVPPVIYDSYPSPDARWTARVVKYNCSPVEEGVEVALEQLHLIDATGAATVADSQLIYCGGLGGFGLAGRFWSDNGRFFYYTTAREGVPDGCGFWEAPLWRLDADALERTPLGAGPRSPDGSRLAAWLDGELVFWDVAAGEQARLSPEIPDVALGPIAWSPAGDALAYLQIESFCPLSGASYLVVVNALTLEQQLLVAATSPTYGGLAWVLPDTIELFDEAGNLWLVDVATGELLGSQ